MNALSPITEAHPVTSPIGRVRSAAPVEAVEPQDWEMLVSPGHVLGERVKQFGAITFAPAVMAWVAGLATVGALIIGGPAIGMRTPQPIIQALAYDPSNYVELSDGRRVSYRLAFLNDLPKTKGITAEQWTQLVPAAGGDFLRYGEDVKSWTATTGLAVQPKVTRPEKALTEHVGRLDTGIVALRQAPWPQAQVVANVDGALAWAIVSRNGCSVVVGPAVPGCKAGDLNSFSPDIAGLRPQVQK